MKRRYVSKLTPEEKRKRCIRLPGRQWRTRGKKEEGSTSYEEEIRVREEGKERDVP